MTYPDLADRSLANFVPMMLRNSTDQSPASVFNRQCLTGSAHRPSDLITYAKLLSRGPRGFCPYHSQPH